MERDARPVAAYGVIVVGSVVALDPGGWYPFGVAKWSVTTVAVAVAVGLSAWARRRPHLPRAFAWTWVGLLAWMALAAVFGADRWYAWIGTPERRLGWSAWLVFATCCALGSSMDLPELRWWRRWAVAAAAWCGLYAAVELVWRAPVAIASATSRLGGPYGSAAYLGAATCLLVPIAASAASDRDEPVAWRAAATAGALLCVVAAVGSGTRAAWIGLGVAGAVALGRAVLGPDRRRRVAPTAVALVLVVLAVAAVGPRLGDVTRRDVGATSRIDEWSLGWATVADRPLLGAGPEGYRLVLADAVTPEYERTYGRDVLPDRAHSGPLDLAVAGGLPAAVAYVVLIGWVVAVALRRLGTSSVHAGLGLACVAYAVQQLFLFPLAEIDPVFWLAAGAVVARPTTEVRSDTSRAGARSRIAIVAASTAVAVVAFAAGVTGIAADRLARRAVDTPGPAALADAGRAADLRPDVVRYHLLVATIAAESGTIAGYDRAVDATERARSVSARDPVVMQVAAQALTDRARASGRATDLAAALDAWTELVARDPNCRACQYGRGVTAALSGDAETARAAWQLAAVLSRPGDDRATAALALLDRQGAAD